MAAFCRRLAPVFSVVLLCLCQEPLNDVDIIIVLQGLEKTDPFLDIFRTTKKVLSFSQLVKSNMSHSISEFNNHVYSCKTARESLLDRRLWNIGVPVVYVCGVLDKGDNDNVALSLLRHLKTRDHHISFLENNPAFSCLGKSIYSYADILSNTTFYSTAIYEINGLIKRIEELEQPDAIVVQVPGNLIKFNDVLPGDFGYGAFIFSHICVPYYVICSISCDLANTELCNYISKELENRFNFHINAFHVSNSFFSVNNSLELKKYSYLHLTAVERDAILETAKRQSNIFYDALNYNDAEGIVQHMLNELELDNT